MKFSVDERLKNLPSYPKASAYGYNGSFVQLSANESPYPPSPHVISALIDSLMYLNRYPPSENELKEAIAKRFNVASENVIIGCGSNEIIELVLKVSKKESKNKVIIPHPTFAFYAIAANIYGYEVIRVPLRDFRISLDEIKKNLDEKVRVIFLSNPNNPTGTIMKRDEFESFIAEIPPEILLVIDEAYYEFVESKEYPTSSKYIERVPVITLRTFSKAYGLAGLRVGYGIGDAEFIEILHKARQPFSISSLALVAAKAALEDASYTKKIVKSILKQKEILYDGLREIGIEFVPSEANFVLVKFGKGAENICRMLLEQGIIVRWMGPMGLPEYVRVTVGKKEETELFLGTLRRLVS
ncbi:MAG: histidinol-phosphate transaminase [Desulfobacterota bacterium]|nr:histidinol-phosphate transaminase [Thermodesulfobacteriota bacterium]MDW8001894.1 histidinol-phosphate transaminase [Deltaproteobacteria bacterium]